MAESDLTLARVRDLLDYDAATGVFRWRRSMRGRVKAGDSAGYTRADGYVRLRIDGRNVWAHRLAWLCVHGAWPAGQIDHINGDPSDNRAANLRDVSASENTQNERRARSRKNGGTLLGAHWSPRWQRWKSSIYAGGRSMHLGWFDSEQQAHEAYVAAKRQMHPGCTL